MEQQQTRPPRPKPMQCPRCERWHDWEWMDAIHYRPRRTISARWVAPPVRSLDEDESVIACPACKELALHEVRERRIMRSLSRWGVPKYARPWGVKDIEYQNDHETDGQFRQHIMAHVQRYGVTRQNRESVETALRWLEYLKGKDPEGSAAGLWIHGPVGTGKTLLAAMICRDLLGCGGMEWTRYSDAYISRHLGRTVTDEDRENPYFWGYSTGKAMPVMWVNESELLRRVKLSWKGDEAPLYAAAKFKGLLIVDEAGAETAPQNGRAAEWKIEAFERLVARRIDRGAVSLFTSNVPARVAFGQVEGKPSPFGRRVADRLRGSVVPLALRGNSWRFVQ